MAVERAASDRMFPMDNVTVAGPVSGW